MSAISVIIPIYNAERFISRCIDSILNQSFTDFELILVDDGSSDCCGKICNEYARKDPRIVVIHQLHMGVSSARNAGLSVAKSQYITFCDSDDEITPDYLSHLVREPETIDLVISGFLYIDQYGIEVNKTVYKYQNENIITSQSVFDLIGEYALSNVWGKRFKRSIIEKHHIHFDEELDFAEDTLFSAEYIVHSVSFLVLQYTDYRYRKCEGTTNLDKYSITLYDRSLKADEKILNVLKSKFPGIAESPQWKMRERPILRKCLFGTLNDNDILLIQKINSIRNIYNNPFFPRTKIELTHMFSGEGRALIFILRSRSAIILLLFHQMSKAKKMLLG